jgi:hypothetical protein
MCYGVHMKALFALIAVSFVGFSAVADTTNLSTPPSTSGAPRVTTSATPLSQALAGAGQLIFLQPLTIPGTFTDGSPFYERTISYGATGADKLRCSAMVSTTSEDQSTDEITGGIDAVFAQGSAISWLSGDADLYDNVRFEVETLTDGSVLQSMSLSFNSLASKMISMDCDIATPAGTVLTVGDFEAATGGLMSLRAQ